MIKLLIVSYYGLNDTINAAAKHLEGQNVIIFNFSYKEQKIHNNDNWKDNLLKTIIDNEIKIILWWCTEINVDDFKEVKDKTNVKYILFNWDDPFNWYIPNNIHSIYLKCKYLDAAFICSNDTEKYINCNKDIIVKTLYPAFDKNIFFPLKEINIDDYNKYKCDISFICTNLYENNKEYPDQIINRKNIVDLIYNNQELHNYTFHIYGPLHLNNYYPKSYKGFIKYTEQNKLFNYSKINLSTHVIGNKDGYLNERTILIIGSGGLLLVDNVKGIENILIPDFDCIIYDKDNIMQKINDILNNKYNISEIKRNCNLKAIRTYDYQKWALTIKNICEEI